MSNMNEINIVAGVSIVKTDVEELIKSKERLSIVTDYVKNSTYIDKSILLILLGESSKEGVRI